MTYKIVLSIAKTADEAKFTAPVAAQIAKSQKASLAGVAVIPEYRQVYWDGAQGNHEQIAQEYQAIANEIEQITIKEAERAGVELHWHTLHPHNTDPTKSLVSYARHFDLIVTNSESGYPRGISPTQPHEALMLETGRPVILTPKTSLEIIGKPILIGWKSDRSAAAAVFNALPLLKLSSQVTIAQILSEDDTTSQNDHSGQLLKETLQRHGIEAECMAAKRGKLGTGQRLFEMATDTGCGLVVMGAYGHSRLREFILGGVTKFAMANGPLPILFSH